MTARALLVLVALLLPSAPHGAPHPGTRAIVPATREWREIQGSLRLNTSTRIVIRGANAQLQSEAALLKADLRSIAGFAPIVVSEGKPRARDIVLTIEADPDFKSDEAYRLTIDDRVRIQARAAAGVFYGTQSLLQLLKLSSDRTTLARGTVLDQPDYSMRAVMLDVGRRYYEVAQLENLLREMAWKKQNTLHLHLSDWPAFRLRSPKYPGLAPLESYDRADIRRIQDTAARYHVTIIPEIDIPAHAVALTAYDPELAFKCSSMRSSPWLVKARVDPTGKAWTIDITRERNRAWLRGLLDEFIPWFDGPYFHIGGDEYQYDADKTQCPELMAAMRAKGFSLPGDVFVDWINETHAHVRSHGKQTVIWNWWTFGDNKTSIQPAKDIVIHVWNESEEQDILRAGYRTILSPEALLYVSPGIENVGANGYGLVDIEHVYQRWKLERNDAVLGYALAVWADSAEGHTDQWFFGKAYEPMSVLAEKLWSGQPSESVWSLLARLNRIGLPPPVVSGRSPQGAARQSSLPARRL